ncbi:hypothetical protein RB195_022242 [Necator americanus]|uniref:Uncharacterized protein n=1 Tax=Necator americanus TaxID=51031 RepID=A0ABR1EGS0_NECAM
MDNIDDEYDRLTASSRLYEDSEEYYFTKRRLSPETPDLMHQSYNHTMVLVTYHRQLFHLRFAADNLIFLHRRFSPVKENQVVCSKTKGV